MNLQKAFDIAYTGVVKQGAPSLDWNYRCCFNGKHGRHCAIGWILVEEEFEDIFDAEYRAFIDGLRMAHDNAIGWEVNPGSNEMFIKIFKASMTTLANDYNLEIPNVQD